MSRFKVGLVSLLSLPALALSLLAPSAYPDEERFAATNPLWKTECGSCHIPYPPQLLSADAWRKTMAQLERHFGTDASLDPAAAREIGNFLAANAGRRRGEPDNRAAPRITETRWFQSEHDDVPPRLWRSPAVKTAANCEACHRDAANGDFSERHLQLPR